MTSKLKTPRIAIVGGGIAGISAAWQLRKRLGSQAEILLIEAHDRLGGKLKTVKFADGILDVGAEAFLNKDEQFPRLVADAELSNQIQRPSSARSAFYTGGRFVDIPKDTLMGIPTSWTSVNEILSPRECERLAGERQGRPMTWQRGDDATVGDLVEARLGKAVVDKLVSPLLGGVYSSSAYDLGVRAAVPDLAAALDEAGESSSEIFLLDVVESVLRAKKLSKEQGISPQGSPFRALGSGYRSLINSLTQKSRADVSLGTTVESLGRTPDGRWNLDPIGTADAVILATPAPVAAVLLDDILPHAAELLNSVELASSVVVGLRYRSDHGIPDRSGVLLGSDGPTEAKAFTFTSRKWPHLGNSLGTFVRASYGTKQEPWYVEASDRALLSYVIDDLHTMTGEYKKPEEFFVQRWHGGIPVYGVYHREKMRDVLSEVQNVSGLAIAGASLNGVGVPATAVTGIDAADKIVTELR